MRMEYEWEVNGGFGKIKFSLRKHYDWSDDCNKLDWLTQEALKDTYMFRVMWQVDDLLGELGQKGGNMNQNFIEEAQVFFSLVKEEEAWTGTK